MTLRRISESNPWRSLNYSLANDADSDDGYDSGYSDGAPGGIWEHNYNPSTSSWPVNLYQQPQPGFDRHKVSSLRTTCAPTPSPPVSRYSHHPSDPSEFHSRRYTTPPLSPDDQSSRHSSPVTRSPAPTGLPPSISHVSHNSSPPPQQQLPDDRDHYYPTARRVELKSRERYHGHQTEMAASPPPRHEDRALRGRDGNIETPHITAAKPPPSDRYHYAQDYSHPRAIQDPPPFRVIRRPEQPQPRKPPSLLHSITLPPLSEFDRAPSFNGPPSSQGSFSYGSTIPSREARSRTNELLPPPMLSKTIQDLFRPMSRDLPRVMHMPFALRKPDAHDIHIQDNPQELSSSSSNIHDHARTSRASINDDPPVASSSGLTHNSYTSNLSDDRYNAQNPLSLRTISESSSIAEIPQTHEETDEIPPPNNARLGRLRTRGGREVRPVVIASSPSSDSECTSVPFEPDDDDDDSSDEYEDSDTDDRGAARRSTSTRQLHRKSSSASNTAVVDPSMSAPMATENANDVSRSGQEARGANSSSHRPRAGEKDNTLPILPPADGRRPKSHQTPWNTQGAPTFKVARQATTVPPALPTGTAKDKGLTWDFSTPDPYKKTRIPYSRNPASTQRKKAALRKAQNLERASSSQRGSVDEEEIDELADDNDGEQRNGAKPKPKKGSFKCPQCTILFTRNFDMSRHIKTVHETAPDEVLRSRTCPCCFTVPSRRDAFRRHLLRVPMSCNRLAQICGKPQPNIQGSQLETLYEMCRQMELRVPDVVRKHLGLQETD